MVRGQGDRALGVFSLGGWTGPVRLAGPGGTAHGPLFYPSSLSAHAPGLGARAGYPYRGRWGEGTSGRRRCPLGTQRSGAAPGAEGSCLDTSLALGNRDIKAAAQISFICRIVLLPLVFLERAEMGYGKLRVPLMEGLSLAGK